MPAVVFYDPKPRRIIDHDLPGLPCVGVELEDGFKFGLHLTQLSTLDDLIEMLEEARTKLVAQYAANATEVLAVEVEQGDLLVLEEQVFRVAHVTVWNDGVRINDALGVTFGTFKPRELVKVVRAEQVMS